MGVLSYLHPVVVLPAKLDLAEFTFSYGVTEVVVSKSRCLFLFGVIVAASAALPAVVSGRCYWWRCCNIVIIFMRGRRMVRLGLLQSFLFSFQVLLRLRHDNLVQHFAGLA